MPLWTKKGDILTRVDDGEMVRVGGLTLSAAAALRRFAPPALAQVGLWLEVRAPNAGHGWGAPELKGQDTDTPYVVLTAITHTTAEAATAARAAILTAANDLQQEAADAYDWPEAAAWTALETQAMAHLRAQDDPIGPDLQADVGQDATLEAITARALAIVGKAQTFRSALGSIKSWRRGAIAAIESAASSGADIERINALRDAMLSERPTQPA